MIWALQNCNARRCLSISLLAYIATIFHCGTMRSNCGRTMHIWCSLFRPPHSLSLSLHWFWTGVWFISSIFALETVSHREEIFPSCETFFSLLNFTISFWSSATRRTIHTAWFHSNTVEQIHFIWCQLSQQFPHAYVTTYLFHLLFSYKHLHNVEMVDGCVRMNERDSKIALSEFCWCFICRAENTRERVWFFVVSV